MKRLILITSSIILSINIYSQDKFSISLDVGSANLTDGYYISINGGIPAIKSLEISPSITYATTFPYNYELGLEDFTDSLTSWNIGIGSWYYNIFALDINLLFKPLDLISDSEYKKHEIYFGIGTGLKHISVLYVTQRQSGEYKEIDSFDLKVFNKIQFTYLIGYKYNINSKLFLGLKFELNGAPHDRVLLLGGQVGYNF